MAADVIAPRLLDRDQAAVYLGSSVDTIDRAIDAGALAVVRLPVSRSRKSGRGVPGVGRRILIDVRDLDSLIDRSKEVVGVTPARVARLGNRQVLPGQLNRG